MLDEEKTKQELIAELTSLRLKRSVWEKQEDKEMTSDQNLHEALAWKDFLLGLYERSFDLSDEALYGYVLDYVVHLTGSLVGFCHLVAEDQKSIVLTAWNNEALKNCTAVYDTHYPVDQAGNWVDCLRLQRPVVYNEFDQAPNKKGLPPGHNPIRRFLSVPVLERGKVRIIVGVGNKTEPYTEQDIFQAEVVAHNLQTIVERRHAEEILKESEGKFRDLVEKSIAGVYLIQDGLLKYVNAKFAEIFGYSIAEMTGNLGPKDVIYEDDLPLVEENLRKRISGELKDIHYGFRIWSKSREIKYVEIYSSLTTYQGNPAVIGTLLDLTEKNRVEKSLIESEEVFRLLFKKSGDANLLLKDGRFFDFNETALKILSCPDKSLLIHLSPADISPERQPDGVLSSEKANQMMEIAFNEGSNRFEWVHRTFDGTEKYLDVVMMPISVRGEKILYVTWREITERKRTEESLRQRETTLSSVFKATPVGLCIMKDRVFQSANKAWYDTFGYTEADIIGHNTRMLYENEEEYEQVGRELVAGLSESGFVSVQTRLQRKDGVSRDATVIAAPLHPEDISLGMVVTIEDITDRKRVEQELRESRRRLTDIIEFLPDATLVVDREGIVLAWNRAMETMTGVKKENMLDRGDYEYALPFYGKRRPILINLALCQDKELEKQYKGVQRWGDTVFGESRTPNLPPGDIYLSATASVLRDSSGNIIAAIECIRDITERTQIEDQLRQAQKMEAIGTLAGGIAHDFNNILASMVGYTELAMMNGDKADLQSGYLEQVMKACDRAKNLVNQILLFSHQREQEKRPVDMIIIVKEALKLLRASLPSTIRINPQISSVPATVIADPTQVHQIVMNLCTNAAHAMRENGGVLDVYVSNLVVSDAMSSINPGLKTGPYVHLMVKDGGHGIETAVIDKIFDPFFTTKRHQGGTGLGLSIVYGIVRSYDGVIQVKSDPGQGTTFNMRALHNPRRFQHFVLSVLIEIGHK